MRIKILAGGAATLTLLSVAHALAQTAPRACAKPPCAAATAPAAKSDRSTEPASADPMSTPADKGAPAPTTTTARPNQPATQSSSSMPAGDLPSGADPGSPTAPSPMPGSR